MERDYLNKSENESYHEYYSRITKNRKAMDIDYSEWAFAMSNGTKEYSSENGRKQFYLMDVVLDELCNEYEELLKSKTNDNDNFYDNKIKEVQDAIKELRIERKKVLAEKLELNRLETKQGRFEAFYENINSTIERLPLPDFKPIECEENDGSYVMCYADPHYGANFESENNNYSREECKKRFEKLSYKTKQKCEKLGINNLTIIGLGDSIQGILRISDVRLNDVSTTECVVEISRLIAAMLNDISEVTNITYYHTMSANHTQPRYLGTKANAMPFEDMEKIIGNYIYDLLRNNYRVNVVLSEKEYTEIELEGQNIISMHGHQIKNVKNAIKDLSQIHRKFYDICFLGHLHGGQSISVGESNGNTQIIIVPSIIGSDPYSDSLMVGSKGMAKMYKIERNTGITEEYTFVLN